MHLQNLLNVLRLRVPIGVLAILLSIPLCYADMRTWDGVHSIDEVDVTMVYFLPSDVKPLHDWKSRADYFADRIVKFHDREFQGQSNLHVNVVEEPFQSGFTTDQLRQGDGDAIFFKTLGEVDRRLKFAQSKSDRFQILLVMSEINWRPLDDFFRVRLGSTAQWQFEGSLREGRHYPGAESGGARATYLADRGVGWGLVSGDGWRVPYTGSDCVVYHEGVGHSIGLPHNEPADGAVMSLGQYEGWINQSWVDRKQKLKLGWEPDRKKNEASLMLFTSLVASVEPPCPKPNDPVVINFQVPTDCELESAELSIQTSVDSTFHVSKLTNEELENRHCELGRFDRPTPISYRLTVHTTSGESETLWGYFQVRSSSEEFPVPRALTPTIQSVTPVEAIVNESEDLIAGVDLPRDSIAGIWRKENNRIYAPKVSGARILLPLKPVPSEYDLTIIAEPTTEPNGLVLGQVVDGHQCLVLLNYEYEKGKYVSAIENVDGANFANNPTRFEGKLFRAYQPFEAVIEVRKNTIRVLVDGHTIIDWKGDASALSLSDYWEVGNPSSLFLGAYDCEFTIYRASITPR